MNPYLEQPDLWQDFHQSFIPCLRELLTEQVRPSYFVKVEEQVYIHEVPTGETGFLARPDAVVVEARRRSTPAAEPTGATLAAPVRGRLAVAVDIVRHSYLEIRDRRGHNLVTVIELLSPSNKQPGPDREQYLAKRLRVLSSNVHLVEIDLLRGGPRLPLEGLSPCDYCALVSRVEDRPHVGVWPIRLRERLPEIPIPLRAPDPHARVDLQQALHRVYDAAGYADYIYQGAPEPPLGLEDAAWARGVAAQAG
jgi:hypothetical protein